MTTPVGNVPRVQTRRLAGDWLGTALARLGIIRHRYTVVPGLYAFGNPTPESPVLVTANYKLTFDILREDLAGLDLWLVVIDTRSINVWCAAGKDLFSTGEVVRRLQAVRLDQLVSHRRVILPQLAAPGVTAREVKRATGFSVSFGPIRSGDIAAYLANGMSATPSMRTATFPLLERLVLIPVELVLLWKTLLLSFLVMFLLSGLGPGIFSFAAALARLPGFAWATLAGVLAGHVAVPLLLPWLPFRAFSAKGALTGTVAAAVLAAAIGGRVAGLELVTLGLWSVSLSSFLAMNFSGSTPYTSPSGVEWEMRRAIPLQTAAIVAGAVLWVIAAFFREGP